MPIKADALGPGRLTFGEAGSPSEWGAQLTKCDLTYKLDEEDPIPVLSGEELDGDDTLTSELSGTVFQSMDKAGLIYWSKLHSMEKVPFEFVPSTAASEFSIKGVVKIVPLTIGGDVKKRNTSDFTFRCVGDPSYIDLPVG